MVYKKIASLARESENFFDSQVKKAGYLSLC